ncbi:hypothetical protein [Piscinibacter sp.]|uniref:hypothetical protein n=1 Tax=Piscinibacter sp. TaxID=1903157 RepID=UPI0039E5A710
MDRETATSISKLADELLAKAAELLEVVNASCSKDERAMLHVPLATVIGEVDVEILEPIYKQFPDLRPSDLEAIQQ